MDSVTRKEKSSQKRFTESCPNKVNDSFYFKGYNFLNSPKIDKCLDWFRRNIATNV